MRAGELPAAEKPRYVKEMFSRIAPRYDLLNSILSLNQDRYWRRVAIKQALVGPGGYGLDVCCGTGMLCREEALAVGSGGRVVGLDFAPPMLEVARQRLEPWLKEGVASLVEGDALNLPFEDDTFDWVTTAFSLRNVADIPRLFTEMRRVTRPGGRVVSLELAKPNGVLLRSAYKLYSALIIPAVGRLVSGVAEAYTYLPTSVAIMPHQREILGLCQKAGFKDTWLVELSGGLAAVHVGLK